MDNLHSLDYLNGQSSLTGLPRWIIFTAWTTWMDNLHCLDYLDVRPSLSGLPGWTNLIACIT
eukprot:8011534-Karenia_brevis.AAC.1